MSAKTPTPPKGLGGAGLALWREMTDGMAYDDPTELETLRQACALAETAEQLAAALDGAALVVAGSRGQDTPNPLLAELRLTRAEVARLLARLRVVEGDDVADLSSRAPGAKMSRSESGRVAAAARWRGKKAAS